MENIQQYFWEAMDKLIPWLLSHGLRVVFIILGTFVVLKIVHKFVEKAVRIAVVSDGFSSKEAERKREDTLIHIFNATIKITLFILASMMVLQEFGVMIGPMLAAAGIVGLAFGFGGQYLIRDIITGLFIILENQYRIGDVIKFDTVSGTVEEISLRKTTLRDLNGTVHHVPHGEVKVVSNLTKEYARVNVDIGVAYHTDLNHVIQVINKTGLALAADPQWTPFILQAPQFLRVEEFADSAITLKILGETKPQRKWEVAGELRKRIKEAFDAEGIEIPFPQVVVHRAPGEAS